MTESSERSMVPQLANTLDFSARDEHIRSLSYGAVQIGFPDNDGVDRCTKASPLLFGDEFHLFEHTVPYSLPQGSQTLVDREPDGIPNRVDRLHGLHLHLAG